MKGKKGYNGGFSSNASRRSNNRRSRRIRRSPVIDTIEDLQEACILLYFAAAAPVFFQGESSQQVGSADHGMAATGGVIPPKAHPGGLYYNCWQCDRSFPTFQGLGGHIAGHNMQDQVNNPYVYWEEGSTSQQPPMKRLCNIERRIHRCFNCGAVFPTGQALGGHMRAHYKGDLSRANHAKNVKKVASTSGVNLPRDDQHCVTFNYDADNDVADVVNGDRDRASSVLVFNIDLNVEPTEEVEDERSRQLNCN